MPCGHCGSCKLVQAGLHPDLFVLLPEVLRRETGWLIADDKAAGEELKRKPSRQIRVLEVRSLIDWSHKTSARGRGKVAVVHPADAMNYTAASALLKTLEEPPAGTRLLLTAADASHLLPTVRSRCQRIVLATPAADAAQAWLAGQGVDQPAVMLAACQGRPLEALARVRAGIDAAAWTALPQAVLRGQVAAVTGWPPPVLVEALQKLCHDAMAHSVGGQAQYFPQPSLPAPAALPALLAWAQELGRIARHADHPWSEALLAESLIQQGRQALSATAGVAGRNRSPGRAMPPSGFATLP
jgi:DNA polymerase-3 subunit delta'